MREFKNKDVVNCVIITLFLSLSITSHLISYRFVDVMGVIVIPSSLTYMACFVLVDILSTFNNRRFLVTIMCCEAIANLIMMYVTSIVVDLPHPTFLLSEQSFDDVFKPIGTMYWANLVGSFVSLVINYFIFSWLYNKCAVGFVLSSAISSTLVILVYTAITDTLAFYNMYPELSLEITVTNVVTNIAFLILFAMPSKFFVSHINKYTGG